MRERGGARVRMSGPPLTSSPRAAWFEFDCTISSFSLLNYRFFFFCLEGGIFVSCESCAQLGAQFHGQEREKNSDREQSRAIFKVIPNTPSIFFILFFFYFTHSRVHAVRVCTSNTWLHSSPNWARAFSLQPFTFGVIEDKNLIAPL